MVDPKLLEILACPVCDDRPPLKEADGFLVCTSCSRSYAIINDIPHLLPEEAIEA